MPHQILIADRDPLVRNGLEEFLHVQLGYEVTAVADGQGAVEAAIARKFDLYILGIDGSNEADVSMRLHNMYPEMQAIFLTEDGEKEAVQDFLRFSIPADRILKKPLADPSALTRLIIGILGPPIV